MLSNYLKVAFRNLSRHRGTTLINLFGLAVAFCACMLIFLWVQDESSYDGYHRDIERVYRIAIDIRTRTANRVFAPINPALTPALKKDLPEAEQVVRVRRETNLLVERGSIQFYEDNILLADPELFEVLTVEFLSGDPETALSAPRTLVISRKTALKYFGDEDPIGQVLTVNGNDLAVTGVLAEPRGNTHLPIDLLTSLDVYKGNRMMENWHSTMFYTYIKTRVPVDPQSTAEKISAICEGYVGEQIKEWGVSYHYILQPIQSIHLGSHLRYEFLPPGNPSTLTLFTAVALFVLIIAGLNFINLATARSANRAREVGLRKVVGAERGQLISQFLLESLLLSFLSLLAALALIAAALGPFNRLSGKELATTALFQPQTLLAVLAVTLVVGLGAGIYPAVFLSSGRPSSALRGMMKHGTRGTLLRRVLVIGQFAVSIFLVTASLVIARQIEFMKSRDLGFDKRQMLILPLRGGISIGGRYSTVKAAFARHPGVLAAATSASIPGRGVNNFATSLIGEEDDKQQSMFYLGVDHDFLGVYGIEMAAGREFQKDISSDTLSGYVINRSAVRAFGWREAREAVGKRLQTGFGASGEIIGVCGDFHYRSLQTVIEPLILVVVPRWLRIINLRIDTSNISGVMDHVQSTWRSLFPDHPFESFFLDADFDRQYRSDERVERVVSVLTGLAIMIACLGLFGLAAFMAEKRTREIGIRKVLGATVPGIVSLLARDFSRWVLTANLLAWPAAWLILSQWLKNFAYRTQFPLWSLLAGGGGALLLALATVSYQSIRAARTDPAKAIKYE